MARMTRMTRMARMASEASGRTASGLPPPPSRKSQQQVARTHSSRTRTLEFAPARIPHDESVQTEWTSSTPGSCTQKGQLFF
eukprot:312810-Pyramimonas_sp.AAC.2